MSPFLVFLNAARNLASMGMKREQVLDFAQREFGELTELMKAQIDNIYKPKKGAPTFKGGDKSIYGRTTAKK